MSIRNQIISSQLSPPPQRPHVLVRPRIQRALSRAIEYPVTILEAETGYGKSTAVISFLAQTEMPVFWYTISGTDRDPTLFLGNLFSALNQRGYSIGEPALNLLESADATNTQAMIVLLNEITQTLNEDVIFVLDDFHKVNEINEIMSLVDWMLERLPGNVHVIISSRRTPNFPSLNKWRVKNLVNEIVTSDLALTPDEIQELFQSQYGFKLDEEEIDALYEKTEGWVIGLQMIWQSLQKKTHADLKAILTDIRGSQTALFSYLAEEVFTQLSEEKQKFLLVTSLLQELDSVICDFLLSSEDADTYLREIHADGLFLEEYRIGVYRYHNMFRDFLRTRLEHTIINSSDLHSRIASYYSAHQFWERSIIHLLQAEDYQGVSQLLEKIGEDLIRKGRQESLNYWISNLPIEVQNNQPHINFLNGEIHRYMSRFTEALEYYHTAEVLYQRAGSDWGLSQALRGRAQVYLDTIRPINAVKLLQDALQLIDPREDPEAAANILTLIAENQLNLGFPQKAEDYLDRALSLSSGLETEIDFIKARILLRTGRIDEGIQLLDTGENQLSTPITRPQRFHREASLLLSLFYSFRGEAKLAEENALTGIKIGEQLRSEFVQCVGYMRLGHTLQLQHTPPWTKQKIDSALKYYQKAIETIDVIRIHVEPLWGMCRAYGFFGETNKAETVAAEALKIAEAAGDAWICVLIRISIGASHSMAGNNEQAEHYLSLAETGAAKVQDPLSLCASRLWLALTALNQGFHNTAAFYLKKLLPIIRERRYEFLLKKHSLLGIKDIESVIPLLLFAREKNIETEFVNELLSSAFDNITYHPGYTLWIRTFGPLEIWRGDHRVRSREWKRDKARQMMMLLAGKRGGWLSKETITEALWPNHDPEAAQRSFKVVLNALNHVLAPDRPRGVETHFIERRHNLFRLNPQANILMDTDWFELHKDTQDISLMKEVIDLYRGKYFEGCQLEENMIAEEQYYHQQFLLLNERLVIKLVQAEDFPQAIEYLYILLAKEDLWESAYVLLIEIYQIMGKTALIHTVYKQAQQAYKERLDAPVPEIIQDAFEKFQQSS